MLVAKSHKQIILNLRQPERITTVIPTAKALEWRGYRLVAVPHRLDEVRVLRNMGIDAPSPMGSYYEWAGRYSPFAHQKITAEFLSLNERAFVLNGMGSGKTLSVLWAYDYLRSIGVVKRMVIISPLSTLERAWGDEIFRHFPHLTFAVLHGSRDRRMKLLALDFDIYIINHDGIRTEQVLERLRERDDIDIVTVDELASFRNSQTERWKAADRLINGERKTGKGRKKWAWGLTGTPTPNAPTDAWAQVKLINPSKTPGYFGAFRDQVMMQQGPYKWTMRHGALDVVRNLMQPSVRFAREDCIDLPPTTYATRECEPTPEQNKAFNAMLKQLRAEHEGGEITAVNEAVKLSKLLQICCLRYDTNVLTQRGWVEIQRVKRTDLVWDGVEWVSHGGAMPMGVKKTIVCGSVYMTEDHLVLSTNGWVTAKEFNIGYASKRLDWESVRLPDGASTARHVKQQDEKGHMAVRMRVWESGRSRKPVFAGGQQTDTKELRLPTRESEAQNGPLPPLSNLGEHATPVLKSERQRLGELRSERYRSVRKMAVLVRELLVRHAGWLRFDANAGSKKQRRTLLPGKLSLGVSTATGAQSEIEPNRRNIGWKNDHSRGRESSRAEACNALSETESLPMVTGEGTGYADVYDILNCGPRNRFVVRGADGTPRIVHNCGVAYGTSGPVQLPAEPRMQLVSDIIDEAEAKVIVFVPLTGALNTLAEFLRRQGHTVATVNGETSKHERDVIFKDFQQSTNPRVLVANAATMSHGLTLTAANTVVWYAPVHSLEIYEQACARVTRPGQKLNTLIVHIEGSPLERKIYERLQGKGKTQGVLLDLLKHMK